MFCMARDHAKYVHFHVGGTSIHLSRTALTGQKTVGNLLFEESIDYMVNFRLFGK